MFLLEEYTHPQIIFTFLAALTGTCFVILIQKGNNKTLYEHRTSAPDTVGDGVTPMDLLSQLPAEILQETLLYLDKSDLLNLARTCHWAYDKAIPVLWEDLELIDCRTVHRGTPDVSDEHDDTQIIRKLLVLASNDWIASHVHTLTHRCHLPPPTIFHELPRISFQGRTLSHDVRTILLLEQACQNLVNVHTLKIIFGHWNLTRGLLTGLLNKSKGSRVRHLWLENCSIAGITGSALSNLDLRGLESLRLRRLPILSQAGRPDVQEVYCRGPFPGRRLDGPSGLRQDGKGGVFRTSTETLRDQEDIITNLVRAQESLISGLLAAVEPEAVKKEFDLLFGKTYSFDDEIYNQLSDEVGSYSSMGTQAPYNTNDLNRLSDSSRPEFALFDTDPSPSFSTLVKSSAASLTSLTLDWVLIRRTDVRASLTSTEVLDRMFQDLFSLQFPALRAFQFRNAVVEETELPPNIYLLDDCSGSGTTPADLCIKFMEAHSNLRCLAWPAERFFRSRTELTPRLSSRAKAIISKLSTSLEELRIDTIYSRSGEFKTDESTDDLGIARQNCRRRFISDFASQMHKIECVKLEGGIPRDEKREVIRALRKSPLQKVVMIGVNCPIGNTWGLHGRDVESLGINDDPTDPDDVDSLEAEDTNAIMQLGVTEPKPVDSNEVFEAQYGWPPSAPLVHTIASYHAETITELKFCGYRGAPHLWDPTPITAYMLAPLRQFHNLRHLIISLWLHTLYEDDHRDDEILSYWLNTRDPSTTALVITTDDQPTGWAKQLAEKYEPSRIAARIVTLMGPYISERAKSQIGGMHVRASFCIGTFGGLFDFDVIIGKAKDGSDELRSWKGPREELHPERRAEKLRRRRWFGTPVRRDLGDGSRTASVSI